MAGSPPAAPASPETPSAKVETRQRLLLAAGEVFAERGYRDATVRDICRRAHANIAAVNYHFGDKERLYRAVLEFAAKFAAERYPQQPPQPGVPAVERLRRFVAVMFERMLDEGRPAWQGKLMSREMVEPSGALDDMVGRYFKPQYEIIAGVVAELLGPSQARDEALVRRCVYSILGQCIFYKHAQPVISRVGPKPGSDAASRAALADHVVAFTLGGLEAMKRGGGAAARGGGAGA